MADNQICVLSWNLQQHGSRYQCHLKSSANLTIRHGKYSAIFIHKLTKNIESLKGQLRASRKVRNI
ncbi:CLUMA_CG001285, isoform A [Clunio marinus]|uniref:CLUMA_CG001285, isoform A n=1 Tax=Clunio marinus TaxID=568069 RepID=A0A1J1HJ94_9DIPT|nr:CLUMA_CG001285, isoform A [Clunio marinus]